MIEVDNRRPLKSRGSGWAQRLAARLAAARISPNQISGASVLSAALGAALLLASGVLPGWWRCGALVAAAACVQGRLVCNLLDGMVAVEYGRGSSAGPIWNELPDRVSDALLLVAAGYGAALAGLAWAQALGWLCAVLAVLTAYVRELGRALGQPADFSGPGAKPQRMAILTFACLVAAAEPRWGWRGQTLAMGLGVIAILAAVTSVRRTRTLAARLRAGFGSVDRSPELAPGQSLMGD